MSESILVVDDEETICLQIGSFFKDRGLDVKVVNDGAGAIEFCRNASVEVAIVDLRLLDMSGLEVLEAVKSVSPETSVIIITAYGNVETAVQSIKLGADNFILKPIQLETLWAMVERILENRRAQLDSAYLKSKLLFLENSLKKLRHPQKLYAEIELLAKNSSTNVFILGETGTGKGMLARTIHELSDRRGARFVDLNCAGLGGELMESELFGHEKGSFTDAKTLKRGLFEVADKGSIFLDEIGELSLPVQAKLLNIIETKTFRRVGGTTNIKVDARLIAATNADIEKLVESGRFRKDLFFRLNVMTLPLPPLRERREDILPLAGDFLQEFNLQLGKTVSGFSPETRRLLCDYSWPGNIRELKNIVERAVLLCQEGTITPANLPENFRLPARTPSGEDDWSLVDAEKRQIEKVLSFCNYNHTKAAKTLKITRTTLLKKIKKYDLE